MHNQWRRHLQFFHCCCLPDARATDSCVGNCYLGDYDDYDYGCGCSPNCEEANDCCDDYHDVCGDWTSCTGNCNSTEINGGCNCDYYSCLHMPWSCCPDYTDACSPKTSCEGSCGVTDYVGCDCGPDCLPNRTCCDDYEELCINQPL